MPNTAATRRLPAALLLLLGLGAVLLTATPAHAATTADRLHLTWTPDNTTLVIEGYGYQPGGTVNVELGPTTLQQTHSDQTGRVHIQIPDHQINTTDAGISIVLTGRAVTGLSRILVSSVPPRTAEQGGAERLPYLIVLTGLTAITLEILHRRRAHRRAARTVFGEAAAAA